MPCAGARCAADYLSKGDDAGAHHSATGEAEDAEATETHEGRTDDIDQWRCPMLDMRGII